MREGGYNRRENSNSAIVSHTTQDRRRNATEKTRHTNSSSINTERERMKGLSPSKMNREQLGQKLKTKIKAEKSTN